MNYMHLFGAVLLRFGNANAVISNVTKDQLICEMMDYRKKKHLNINHINHPTS